MLKDRFDKVHAAAVVVVLIALVLFMTGFTGTDLAQRKSGLDPDVQKALQDRARAAFLEDVYAPVEARIRSGNLAAALLELEELQREYPGEPHALLLRGAVLVGQGAIHQGISEYARAIKANGDYVDARSGLGRRDEIEALVTTYLPVVKSRLQANPENRELKTGLRDLYYLQSRLAGGCE